MSFRREKYVPRGGPDGGDGGRGGNVFLETDEGLSTLLDLRFQYETRADHGGHGLGKDMCGRSGEDRVIRVPVGTVVKQAESGGVLADLVSPGQRLLVAAGGRGGRGNARFKSSTNRAPRRADPGEEGEERILLLELKLIADVGIVGLPNAGKSTLVSRISAARPKIADYPFTTLAPNLGVVSWGAYKSFVVADLPGLVYGASRGVGLGSRFLRHAERCGLLLFLLDVSGLPEDDPTGAYDLLQGELEAHNPELARRPRLVALSKIDVRPPEEALEEVAESFRKKGIVIRLVSSVSGRGIDELVHELGRLVEQAREERAGEGG